MVLGFPVGGWSVSVLLRPPTGVPTPRSAPVGSLRGGTPGRSRGNTDQSVVAVRPGALAPLAGPVLPPATSGGCTVWLSPHRSPSPAADHPCRARCRSLVRCSRSAETNSSRTIETEFEKKLSGSVPEVTLAPLAHSQYTLLPPRDL